MYLLPALLVVCLPERTSAVVRNICTAARASGCHFACLHICLIGCSSVCLEVCSVARLLIWLHLAAGLVTYQSVWHSVCSSACSAGCSSCCSFWCPFCSSVNLIICRSVLLPAGCNLIHLPVPQARCQSVSSSANLAVKVPFICLIHRPNPNPSLHLPIWQAERQSGESSAHSAATGSIWQHFHSSAGSIICRPRFRRFICHSGRPWRFICQIWQAVDHSGHPSL